MSLTSISRQDSIFKKRSPSYTPHLTAVSEANARARSARVTASPPSTPPLSFSSSVTTYSEDTPYDNSDSLAYPSIPPTSEQLVSADHLQFGFCLNENYRYKSSHKPGTELKEAPQHDPPYYILFTTYLSVLFLICVGHIRDFFGKRFYPAFYRHLVPNDVSMFLCVDRHFRTPGLFDLVHRL